MVALLKTASIEIEDWNRINATLEKSVAKGVASKHLPFSDYYVGLFKNTENKLGGKIAFFTKQEEHVESALGRGYSP